MKKMLIGILPLIGWVSFSSADDLDEALEAERREQTATAITIIFDNSGSMDDGGKMFQAKSAFTQWLTTVPDYYSLGLIDFNAGRGRLVHEIGANLHEAISIHVRAASPYGKTPVVDCLNLAKEAIRKRRAEHSPYERHVVVVFTDGRETVDSRGDRGVARAILELRNEVVEVVGIGFHGEGDYMAPVATRYFEAGNEAELLKGLSAVDAEIGGDQDIEITEQDLATIEKLDIPLPPAPAAE
ncbi:MAG: vWA domain-containing protein [Verrucomicrobiota bacterium]